MNSLKLIQTMVHLLELQNMAALNNNGGTNFIPGRIGAIHRFTETQDPSTPRHITNRGVPKNNTVPSLHNS